MQHTTISTFRQFVDLVFAMRKTGSSKEKKALLATIEPGSFAQELLGWTYNPYMCFYTSGYHTFGPTIPGIPQIEEGLLQERIKELLFRLSSREIVGKNAACHKVALFSALDENETSVMNGVLNKDLKIGAKESTINSVFPGLIPEFKCALANSFDPNSLTNVFPLQVEYKYDGDRSIVFVIDGEVVYRSRSGHIQESFAGLFDEEFILMSKIAGRNLVFEGEVIGASFQQLAKARGRKADKSSLRYVAFDCLPLEDWQNRVSLKQSERTANLVRLLQQLGSYDKVLPTTYAIVNNINELIGFFDDAVDAGLEGVMVKEMHEMYQWRRSNSWRKLKPVYNTDADLRIVGWQHGRPGSRFEKTIGSLIFEGLVENKFVRVSVNSGITDALRSYFWENRDNILDEVWVIGYDSITQDQNNSDVWSLRFPRLIRKRTDKTNTDE